MIDLQKEKKLYSSAQFKAVILDDPYSDRVRCDHPQFNSIQQLVDKLVQTAEENKRGKIMTMLESEWVPQLKNYDFRLAGIMPKYYRGQKDCAVMTLNLDESRLKLANPKEVKKVENILENVETLTSKEIQELQAAPTILAQEERAEDIAELLGETFKEYPTPSHDPRYIEKQIQNETPFRFIKEDNQIIACASADLVPLAKTAELTDCATNPNYRKRGLMAKILASLMDDLRKMGYPTAYTFSRARIPGINIVFKKLGFKKRGTLHQNCRIGDGIEDMNIWSREL